MNLSIFLILVLLLGCCSLISAVEISMEVTGLAKPLTNEEAWERLPKAIAGSGQSLPSWALKIAGQLPRTTAALLELDYAQRTGSPVEPRLRAAMRWVAAHANRCEYSEAYAAADARRAGFDEDRLASLGQDGFPGWPEPERSALEFARKMSVDSDSVTDDEFARLVEAYGEKQAASMVLLLAYSNFQDRLIHCLDIAPEPGEAMPPLAVSFDPAAYTMTTRRSIQRTTMPLTEGGDSDGVDDDPEWARVSYGSLQERLEIQRQKPTRLRIPSWDEISQNIPEGLFRKPSDIVWYRIVFGYAPELAVPFELFMRTAADEARPEWDPIFGSSLFWVVTRTIQCPYCMGHCEMNWEVAGLSKPEIAERSRLLAGEDWSSFHPAEQRAFAFARKLTQSPGQVDDSDRLGLIRDFGETRALIVMLNASRYNYMTRISNGFQLTLERDNVFFDYYNTKSPIASSNGAGSDRSTRPAIPMLSDEEAWARLPVRVAGRESALPVWARAIANQLPRTTAAMLQLDHAQRTRNSLDPILRAKMRWVIADANRCEYSRAYALSDLRRAGGDDATIDNLTGDPAAWPEADRDPLEFARLHTLDAPTITDEHFARLRDRFGDRGVAAMVLLGAYGNFQDRIVLGLNLPLEPNGPLAPLNVQFSPETFQPNPVLPSRTAGFELLASGQLVVESEPEWTSLTYDELQKRLESQRSRSPRLQVPAWEEIKESLPEGFRARPTRIVWNLVGFGYVPELAVPWSMSTRTLWAEAPQDRVFEESLFWIQTRAIRCNYCMGHCEMLLEVAGLDKTDIAERTRRLAGDDWSCFPPSEQRAFSYAIKLSRRPWELTVADYEELEQALTPEKALPIFWWLCRGLYMTRVSDGFQLPLERENVFEGLFQTAPETSVSGRDEDRSAE